MKDILKKLASAVYTRTDEPGHRFKKILFLRHHKLTDPEVVHEILKRHEDFGRPEFVRKGLSRYIGNALIVAEGDEWQHMRERMNEVFSSKIVSAHMAPMIVKECDAMIDRWLDEKKPVDIGHEMRGLAANVIMKVIFGPPVNGVPVVTDKEMDNIISLSSTHIGSFREPSWLTKLSHIVGLPHSFLGREPANLRTATDQVNIILDRTLARKREMPAHELSETDILGRLLTMKDAKKDTPLSDMQIRHEAVQHIVAGHETTAGALTFAFYDLLKNPEKIEALRAQTNDVVKGGRVEARHAKSLGYARKAFQEAMRLNPSFYEFTRTALVDAEIGGIRFKKGDEITVDVSGMQNAAAHFKQPEEYCPERFDKPAGHAYAPFGGGPRVCIGMPLAMAEGPLVLAEVFNRVSLTMIEEPKEIVRAFTQGFKTPLIASVVSI